MATPTNGKSKKTTPKPNLIKVMFEGVLDVFLPKNFSTLAPAAPGPAPTPAPPVPPKSPPAPPVYIGNSRRVNWSVVGLLATVVLGIWFIHDELMIYHTSLPTIGGGQKMAVTVPPECRDGSCQSPTPQDKLHQYDVANADCKPGETRTIKVDLPGHPGGVRTLTQKCVYR